ncbi:MAG: GntR family transcriptional regulator [Chitinivibrionales bacterium]|nr:GntR family transcriptional regulator [Chitinivibrionales bacterium]
MPGRAPKPRCRAREFLVAQVRAALKSGSPVLPSIDTMCRRAGVSRMTLWSEVKALQGAGIVAVVPHGAVIALKPAAESQLPVEAAVPQLVGPRWALVRNRIRNDILNHVFAPGSPLPTFKELASTYATGYRTLNKALYSLAEEGLVVPEGKRFRAFTYPVKRSWPAVVLITRFDTFSDLANLTVLSREYLGALEQSLHRSRIRLHILRYDEVTTHDATGFNWRNYQRMYTILGYIVWSLPLHSQELVGLLRSLAACGKPVSVLDESRPADIPPSTARNRYIKRFLMAGGYEGARESARFLLRRGHRKLAYIATYDDRAESSAIRNRLRGIRDACSEVEGAEVVYFADRQYLSEEQVIEAGKRTEPYKTVLEHMSTFTDSLRREGLDRLLYTSVKSLDMDVGPIYEYHLAKSLFTLAFADRTITGWVCFNDRIAALALHFLAERGVGVPGEISVTGFDDSEIAFGEQLTSWNFNVPAVVSAMLDHIIMFRQMPGEGSAEPMVVPGMIMERASTGPLHRRQRENAVDNLQDHG